MEIKDVTILLDRKATSIKCDCGHEFIVEAVIRRKDGYDNEVITTWVQVPNESGSYCFYCGKKLK